MLRRSQLLQTPVRHIDPTAFDARPLLSAYRQAGLQARNLGRAAEVLDRMLADEECAVILCLAGSLISAGLKESLLRLVESNMVDAVVSTGANAVDQDFFEGLGFRHYVAPGSPEAPLLGDPELRELGIGRLYDTYIDGRELRICDHTVKAILDELLPGAYGSRQLIEQLADYLERHQPDARSLLLACRRRGVPVFVPAFSDCSAGIGLVVHQTERLRRGEPVVSVDSGRDLRELTELKLASRRTGLLVVGGGAPKNFAQDCVVAAELLGQVPSPHAYAVQLSLADPRAGARSGATLREAHSWGKVEVAQEQMVFGEASTLLPLLVSDAYHRATWRGRSGRRLADLFAPVSGAPQASHP